MSLRWNPAVSELWQPARRDVTTESNQEKPEEFMKRTSRKPSNLSESLQRHLNAYALAASAAGVAALALAQPAEAKIVYTPAHAKFGRNTEVLLDLNHDGITDFHLINNFSNFGYRNSYRFFVSASNQPNSIQGKEDASALPAGARIGPKQRFAHNATSMAHFYTSSGQIITSSGPWKNVKSRYLGLKFFINSKTHYGWARLSVTVHRDGIYGISAILTGYAYETVSNKPLTDQRELAIWHKTQSAPPTPIAVGEELAKGISHFTTSDSVATWLVSTQRPIQGQPCTVGDLFSNTSGSSALYACTASGTWTPIGSSQ
jgi:hypothetical protein